VISHRRVKELRRVDSTRVRHELIYAVSRFSEAVAQLRVHAIAIVELAEETERRAFEYIDAEE
jgi:hypothetical protein